MYIVLSERDYKLALKEKLINSGSELTPAGQRRMTLRGTKRELAKFGITDGRSKTSDGWCGG